MSLDQRISFRDAAGEREKRVRTRAHLMDCAIAEFAARGIDKTSIDHIATRAGVSRGTFYYHFSNKTDVVEAVGRAVAVGFVTLVDQAIRDVSSGSERVALATQIFIERTTSTRHWARLIVDALANMGSFRGHISKGIRKDVMIGIRSGEFTVEPDDLLFDSLLAVVSTAMRKMLDSPGAENVSARAAQYVLLMLGTPPAIARALPFDVKAKYGLDKPQTPEAVQRELDEIMPLLLNQITADTD